MRSVIEPPVNPPEDKECPYHTGQFEPCPECEAENEAWADHLVDLYREERAS